MKILAAVRRFALSACSLAALLGLAAPAFATHLRGGTLSWRVTATTSTTYTVQFTLIESSRWSYPGTAGTCGTPSQAANTCPALNSSVSLSTLTGGNFTFGDGTAVVPTGTVTSINQAQDYLQATFVFSHTYSNSYQNVTAYFASSNRISTLKIGHDQPEYIDTIVQNHTNGSAVAATPAILAVPLQPTVKINIATAVTDIDPSVVLVYRLATLAELYGPTVSSVPCPSGVAYTSNAPPGFTVSSTGLVTWNTSLIAGSITGGNCNFGTPAAGDLWPAQIMVEAHDKTSGALITETPIDLLLEFVNPVGALPTVTLSPAGPQTVAIGTPITFMATGSSSNAGAKVTLNASGVPNGATVTGLNAAVTPPAISNFSWTPGPTQDGTYVITYTVTDENLQQATASETLVVATLPTISCSAGISVPYGSTGTVSATAYDPSNELLNVVWTVDGVPVQTDNGLTAYPNPYVDSLTRNFGAPGAHTVTATATDPHGVSVSCSPAVTVTQASQTITFGPLPNLTYGAPDFPLSATASSNLAVSYSATGSCAIVGANTVHITGAGPCQITASQSGNADYSPATSVTQPFSIAPAPVTITGGSGFSVYDGTVKVPPACSITGTYTGDLTCSNSPATVGPDAGTTTINAVATAPDLANFAFTQVPGTYTISPAPQVITFTPVPASPDVAGNSVVLSATGGASGNPISFSVLSGNATLASDGVTLTYTGAGTVVVAADQAGSVDFTPAPEVTATIVVNPAVAAYSGGTVPVASQSSILTATLNFPNGGTLGSLNYLTQGAANLDFIGCSNKKQPKPAKGSLPTSFGCGSKTTGPVPICSVGTAYAAGQICTVSYIFQPTHPGQRLGAVAAVDNNGNPMGMSYLSGVGTGPQVFFPGNQTTYVLGSGLSTPQGAGGVAVDAQGNVYLADTGNNVVKEVLAVDGSIPATNPTILTLATGFNNPGGVAVDGAGNVYVADSLNNAVKEIVAVGGSIPATNPTVLTLATGFNGPQGVAVDRAGNVYVADTYHNAVKEIVAVGGSIPATNPTILTLGSGFNQLYSVAVDATGNVYVADTVNNAVKEIVAVGGSIPASNPAILTLGSGFNFPVSVAVDSANNIVVSDAGNNSIKVLLAVGGSVPAVNPTVLNLGNHFSAYQGIAVDGAGNVFISAYGYGNVTFGEIPLATPPSVAFADTNVGSTSSDSPQTVTVGNNGYDPTSINPLSLSAVSTGTTSFVLDASNACSTSTSLEPGQTCALAVDFTPQTPGTPLTDAVTLVDNNLNNILSTSSPQNVPLSGNGLQQTPGVTVSAASITYGTASVPLSATVAYTGSLAPTGAVTFTIDSGSPVTATCTGTASPLNCTATYPSGTLGVPAHTITASIAATPGFTAASGSNTLTVSPAALTITAGSYTGVYDGATHALSACTVSANFDGLTCTNSPAGPVGPDAGQSVVTPILSGSAANYSVTSVNGSWSITAKAVTVTAGSYTGTYNGVAHATTSCTSTYPGVTCTNSPASVGPGVGSGAVSPVVSYVAGIPADYTITTVTGSYSITPAAASITPNPASKVYGSADPTLTGTTSGFLPVDNIAVIYSRTAGQTVAGSPYVISGTVTPNPALANYTVTYNTAPFTITKLAASVTPNAASKVYGASDPAFTGTLSGFLTADGVTATYSRTSGETVAGSPYTISATLSPSAVLSNYSVTYNTAAFTITKATPVVSWTTPAGIGYGTPLSATQLNATAVPAGGSFSYTPGAGTVLGAGTQTLSVLYTPSDTADYTTASATVSLSVAQATPVVTWANPPSIVYGTGTGAAQKTATATGVNGVSLPGNFFYTTPDGTVFPVGTHPLGVAFTPTDGTDYAPVSAYATLTVTKATPAISWTTPAAITYGTALSATQLNATSPVAGTFSYSPAAGTVLHAGTQTLTVTFTPTDTTDYNPATATVSLVVNKATPVITWPTPASITYGTPISSTQLNATASYLGSPVAGTFLYTSEAGPNPLGVLLPPGTTALSATLTPTDSTDFNSVTAYVVFTVSKAQTTTTLAVATKQTVTGTTATLTATVKPQIGGTPTGTVSYYNGSALLGTAAVGSPFTTGVLPVGTDQLTAVYSGDSNFVGSSSSASAVTSVAPTVVQLIPALTKVIYPASSLAFTVIVPLKNLQLISGTVTLYDNGTVIGTYSLPVAGVLASVTPQLAVGTHNLQAVYGGNGQYPPGESPVITVMVAPL